MYSTVSVLFNEPKLLKCVSGFHRRVVQFLVSVLFNEPKLLKLKCGTNYNDVGVLSFSALQRAEIAEI